jgi:alkylated DNA repair dioxygenase AlkB
MNTIKTDKSFLDIYEFHEYKNLLLSCIDEIKDKLIDKPQITVFGKKCYQQRSIGFFSNSSIGYYYSNQIAKSIPLTNSLSIILDLINNKFNADFNGILVNKYKDGNDYISAHSDDEKTLDSVTVVAISVGAIRTFRIRSKIDKKIHTDIKAAPFQIIHMYGDFQKEFTHEIPIEKKVTETRYSLTFRKHLK